MSFPRFFGIVIAAAAVMFPLVGWAQSNDDASLSSQDKHSIEGLVDIGLAWPRFWSNQGTNEHVGSSLSGSLLVYLGYGMSIGVAAEWIRLPWTTQLSTQGHFDSVMITPEGRYTFNHKGRLLPYAYVGFGLGILSVSPESPSGKQLGGPGARAGIGIDYRILPRLRVGLSAGLSLMTIGTEARVPQPPYVEPGVPTDPGNSWRLRLGGCGEFL